ncbi:UBA-like domain-containing protein 2 [Halichondria panicea]|uniref:UBA-like domain-containing protein 2 n=1 Tax=Halichondria panicea TaxID=6063 RepID=UPI00312BBCB1
MSSEQSGHSQGDVSMEILRKQVMVNQFVNAVGCTSEQATHILQSAQWQFEVALSIFFEGHSVPSKGQAQPQPQMQVTPSAHSSSAGSSLGSRMSCQCVPTNTPATPPAFPDTLAMFAQLNTSSPADSAQSLLQEPPIVRCQQMSNS